MNGLRVLSLFDGISCARVALDRANIPVKTYSACEIDKYAIAISSKNYPDIVQLGDVRTATLPTEIDLLIGGSPCQDLSIAKKDRKGLEGDRSGLFWEYVRILRELKPKWFVLENVASMPKKDRDIITEQLGVEPVLFNASLVSAQSRKRLFWTNIAFTLPEDRNIVLRDILQPDAEVDESMVVDGKAFCLTASYHKVGTGEKETEHNRARKQRTMVKVGYVGEGEQHGQGGQAHRVYSPDGKSMTLSSFSPLIKVGHIGEKEHQANRVYSTEGKAPTQCKGPNGGATPTLIKVGHIGEKEHPDGKSVTLSANGGGGGAKMTQDHIRKLTPIECERLQGLPDNYTEGIAKTNRYKSIGNAFNVDVVAHILSQLA